MSAFTVCAAGIAGVLAGEVGLAGAAGGADEIELLYEQGNRAISLVHRAHYEFEDANRGRRQFICVIDGVMPWIAFENPVSGMRFPWIFIDGVFHLGELRTLRRLV